MKLLPLKQWFCDDCGEVIKSVEDGYFEFLRNANTRMNHGFRIVHHAPKSPRHPESDCYKYTNHPGRMDLDLKRHTGDLGLVTLLSFIDVGLHHNLEYDGPWVADFREWTEMMRRLFLPYYEEARLYWSNAEEDGFFSDSNEVSIYLPSTLKGLIETYES